MNEVYYDVYEVIEGEENKIARFMSPPGRYELRHLEDEGLNTQTFIVYKVTIVTEEINRYTMQEDV